MRRPPVPTTPTGAPLWAPVALTPPAPEGPGGPDAVGPHAAFVSRPRAGAAPPPAFEPIDEAEAFLASHPDLIDRAAAKAAAEAARPRADVLWEHVVRHFEYYLVGASLTIMAVVSGLVLLGGSAGVTAGVTGVGVLSLQAAIQAVDRHRQRHLRARALYEIREMLRDRVLNELAALKVMSDEFDLGIDHRFEELNGTIDEVAELINELSEEQLDTWKLTYARSARHFAMPPGEA